MPGTHRPERYTVDLATDGPGRWRVRVMDQVSDRILADASTSDRAVAVHATVRALVDLEPKVLGCLVPPSLSPAPVPTQTLRWLAHRIGMADREDMDVEAIVTYVAALVRAHADEWVQR